jgi:hypothetical protein
MSVERDNYCFICGHYLADATVLTCKNKKQFIGDHTGGNKYSKPSIENSNEQSVYIYNPENEILFHTECSELLSKKFKYKLKWKDIAENVEFPNAHTLVPYNGIQRPPDVNQIKNGVKWTEDQIIEEWEPVIDEIRTKNNDEKKEKKEKLQLKRELKREQLRKQRDKKLERVEGLKLKVQKLSLSLKNEETQLENKQAALESLTSQVKRVKAEKAIAKLEEKITKREESIEKENVKLQELQTEYDLFLKAWF